MILTLEHIKDYVNYRFESGEFNNVDSISAYHFDDDGDEFYKKLDIAVKVVSHKGSGTKTNYSYFSPEKEDVITFVKSLMRNENLDILLDGNS